MNTAEELQTIPGLGLKGRDEVNKALYHFIVYMPGFTYCIKVSLN